MQCNNPTRSLYVHISLLAIGSYSCELHVYHSLCTYGLEFERIERAHVISFDVIK